MLEFAKRINDMCEEKDITFRCHTQRHPVLEPRIKVAFSHYDDDYLIVFPYELCALLKISNPNMIDGGWKAGFLPVDYKLSESEAKAVFYAVKV